MSLDKKKSQITVSLSWVFMGIVGMFFIIIAYNIVDNYQQNEQAKFEVELKQTLRNILNNVARTTGIEDNSFQPIGNIFFDSRVELICVEGNLPILAINDNYDTNNQFLQNYPAFMTNIRNHRTDQTYLVVENFRMPFKITSMLAMVSKRNLIVFDKNSDITDKLIEKFQRSSYSELNYIVEDFSDLSNLNNQIRNMNLNSIMLVSDTDVILGGGFTLSDIRVNTYLVQIDETSNYYGKVHFYQKDGTQTTFNYLNSREDYSMVTMAIFSNPDSFECSHNKIINMIPQIIDFYIIKAQYLEEKSKTTQVCSSTLIVQNAPEFEGSQQTALYRDVRESLVELRDHINTQRFNNLEETYNLVTKVKATAETLERFNCQYVY